MKTQKNNSENCRVPLLEYMKKTESRNASCYICLDKPYLLIKYVSESTWFLGELLKQQLSEIDPLAEPDTHKALTSIAKDVSKLWTSSTSHSLEYYFTDMLDYLENKA